MGQAIKDLGWKREDYVLGTKAGRGRCVGVGGGFEKGERGVSAPVCTRRPTCRHVSLHQAPAGGVPHPWLCGDEMGRAAAVGLQVYFGSQLPSMTINAKGLSRKHIIEGVRGWVLGWAGELGTQGAAFVKDCFS